MVFVAEGQNLLHHTGQLARFAVGVVDPQGRIEIVECLAPLRTPVAELAPLDVERRFGSSRVDCGRERFEASGRIPQPLAADVVRYFVADHRRDLFAPFRRFADRSGREVVQRRVGEADHAVGEAAGRGAAAGIYVYFIMIQYLVVLLPAVESLGIVRTHQDRELHVVSVRLAQVAERPDRVRRFFEQELHGRRLDAVGVFRCGAGDFGHLEAVQLRRQCVRRFERVLRRDDEYDLVTQSALCGIFRQGDVSLVDGIERTEV